MQLREHRRRVAPGARTLSHRCFDDGGVGALRAHMLPVVSDVAPRWLAGWLPIDESIPLLVALPRLVHWCVAEVPGAPGKTGST
jgi:hypothetical protein